MLIFCLDKQVEFSLVANRKHRETFSCSKLCRDGHIVELATAQEGTGEKSER